MSIPLPTRVLFIMAMAVAPLAAQEAAKPSAPTTTAAAPLRVLFIGNSLTGTNDLPGTVAALAKAGGQREFVCDRWTPGGRTLKDQWTDPKTRALNKITGATWDYVVLQDQSTQPLKAPEEMTTYGTLFADAVTKQGARPVWYMTWTRRDAQDRQPEYTKAYTELCAATHGMLVPAGTAWQVFSAAHPTVQLYKDDRHPTPTGTYLVACTFYAVFFRTSPVGLGGAPTAKLDPALVKPLQEAAWAAVQAVPPALAPATVPAAKP